MEEFLNPKATITPGVAGSLMMLLANSICYYFPECPFRFVSLFLSFLIAFSIVGSAEMMKNTKIYQKVTLFVLNALVIFTVGVGSSNLAADVETKHASLFQINNAYAQIPSYCDNIRDPNPQRQMEMIMRCREDMRRQDAYRQQQMQQMQKGPLYNNPQQQFFRR